MCLAGSAGSSGSQMMAVWSALVARCRSTQLAQTFSVPSSNQRISMLPGSNEVFFTRVNGLIQSTRRACSAQNPSGSDTLAAYSSS